MKKKIISLLLAVSLLVAQGYCADKAIVYDTTNKKVKTSDPLPVLQGGSGASTAAGARTNLGAVGTTGDESIADIKTFTSIPVFPASDPTTDNQGARKAYVDTKISKTTAGEIAAMTEKTTLADNDLFLIEDSAAGNAKKKVKKSNVSSVRNQVYTSGSGNWTAPAGVTLVYVTMCGGGGGSGGGTTLVAGGGGGGAASIIKYVYAVTPTNTYAYSVGAAGAAGEVDGNGGSGGSSTFGTGTVLTTAGGTGGQGASVGGAGGAGASSSLDGLTDGTAGKATFVGGNGGNRNAGNDDLGGGGGASRLGNGGLGGIGPSQPGYPGDYGGGAGAPANHNPAVGGQPGGSGIIILEW